MKYAAFRQKFLQTHHVAYSNSVSVSKQRNALLCCSKFSWPVHYWCTQRLVSSSAKNISGSNIISVTDNEPDQTHIRFKLNGLVILHENGSFPKMRFFFAFHFQCISFMYSFVAIMVPSNKVTGKVRVIFFSFVLVQAAQCAWLANEIMITSPLEAVRKTHIHPPDSAHTNHHSPEWRKTQRNFPDNINQPSQRKTTCIPTKRLDLMKYG